MTCVNNQIIDIFIRRKKAVLDEETDEETDYYIGVVLALGTAVTGAMANVCIAGQSLLLIMKSFN